MKALTLTQPWATLVAIGEKHMETRSWSTRYRGPLAIHAAKGFPRWAIELALTDPFRSVLAKAGVQQLADLPRGLVIAQCRLVDCLPIEANCGKDAGEHSYEGLCGPLSTRPVDAEIPRPCFCGTSAYAFVDLDQPHTARVA